MLHVCEGYKRCTMRCLVVLTSVYVHVCVNYLMTLYMVLVLMQNVKVRTYRAYMCVQKGYFDQVWNSIILFRLCNVELHLQRQPKLYTCEVTSWWSLQMLPVVKK